MQETGVNSNHSLSSLPSPCAPSMPAAPCAAPLPNSGHISPPSSPPSTFSKSRRFRLPLPTAATVPFSDRSMGQNQSTVASPSPGQRFKRAFSTRRKKSGDEPTYQGKELDRVQSVPPSPVSTTSPPTPTVAKHFTLFGYRRPSLISPATSPNTPPPTNPYGLPTGMKPQSSADEHAKPLIINSQISAAVQVMRQDEDGTKSEETHFARTERKGLGTEQMKEDWRKSDATMASHYTIRPGAGGPHKPRPVSVAESSHSGNTIVPMNKRVSILMMDSELDTPQEISDGSDGVYVAVPRVQSSPSALHAQNRRSLTLKFGSALSFKTKTSPPELYIEAPPDFQPVTPSQSRDPLPVYQAHTRAINTTAASGFIAPLNGHSQPSQPTGNHIRGRLAAWTAASSSLQHTEAPQPPPPSYPNRSTGTAKAPPNFRQSAVSISGSIAPAAMDLGKRAMEKMGRAWGSRGVGSSGYASSPTESTFSRRRTADLVMGRHPNDSTPSQISSISTSGKGKRRTPNAPSGSWSIASSSTSISDSGHALSAINLSKRLRGPISSGGLVFGRKLADCVRDTAVDAVRLQLTSGEYFSEEAEDNSDFGIRQLEERLLPAVVVRCVQHLLTWGVQEEGLFRMNGRSSHIRELQSEFDQGVDYDISECAPCDIDPHVVSSLFKLYLREMPEPLLTHELMPYFDVVMAAEDSLDPARSQAHVGMSEPTLPIGSESGRDQAMRKPPSLSTLAMPNLAGMRSASQSSVYAIATLISRLPRENRDLLFTLTELMKATASRSKQTKMPLANLLLVFCPSLNMKPSLLRILCESDEIWRGPPNMMETAIPIAAIHDQDSIHSRESSLNSIDDSPVSQLGIPIGFRRGVNRGHIQTMHGNLSSGSSFSDPTPPETTSDTLSYEDDASDISFSDGLHSTKAGTRKTSPTLSSSVESLATPSTSSEGPSFGISPTKNDPYMSPVIADQTLLPLHPPPQNTIVSPPVPFPSSIGTVPTTSRSARISSPNLPMSIATTHHKTSSRPSLHLLFSRKSASSLISSPVPHPNPPSGFEAHGVTQPPVLDTTINLSPIRLQFEPGELCKPDLTVVPTLSRLQSTSSTATDSPMSAFYATPTGSFISISSEKTTEPHDKYVRSASRLSIALGSDNPDGDWTKSVLQAADIDNDQLVAGQR